MLLLYLLLLLSLLLLLLCYQVLLDAWWAAIIIMYLLTQHDMRGLEIWTHTSVHVMAPIQAPKFVLISAEQWGPLRKCLFWFQLWKHPGTYMTDNSLIVWLFKRTCFHLVNKTFLNRFLLCSVSKIQWSNFEIHISQNILQCLWTDHVSNIAAWNNEVQNNLATEWKWKSLHDKRILIGAF